MYFKLASKSKGDAQECDHSCKKQENERKKKKKKKTNVQVSASGACSIRGSKANGSLILVLITKTKEKFVSHNAHKVKALVVRNHLLYQTTQSLSPQTTSQTH